ncbi:MAG: glucose-1-phosphate thymidylyltransferase [Oligoflexales bacterium]|nr:glucose-1-phosphate thymidylyltransferase [Oligoflexales bacterium]
MSDMLTLGTLVNLDELYHSDKFPDISPFRFLGKDLTGFIEALLDELGVKDRPVIRGKAHPQAFLEGRVYVEEDAVIDPTAYIIGPAYIGRKAQVRHGAFIRGSVYAGPNSVVGHTTEVKGSIFFDGAKAGHFAYVGDSILGRSVNLGAGTKLANLKLKKGEVRVIIPGHGSAYPTGLKKLGALVGDEAQTGCNSVLSPGTILYPRTLVYPCAHYHGTLLEGVAR